MKLMRKYIVPSLSLCGVLLAAALLTRMPALHIDIPFLHAVLVAPLNAAISAFYLARFRNIAPLAIAVVALSLLLGSMQPLMALGFLVPLVATTAAWLILRLRSNMLAAGVAAFSFGSLSYPALAAASLVSGKLMTNDPLSFAVPFALTCGLAYLGTLLGLWLGNLHACKVGAAQAGNQEASRCE